MGGERDEMGSPSPKSGRLLQLNPETGSSPPGTQTSHLDVYGRLLLGHLGGSLSGSGLSFGGSGGGVSGEGLLPCLLVLDGVVDEVCDRR